MAFLRSWSTPSYFASGLACVLSVALVTSAEATLIGVHRPDVPPGADITASFLNVTYNSGSGLFQANGFPVTLDLNALPPPDFNINSSLSSDFLLQRNVTTAGVATGGSITIKGGIPALSIPNGTTLLTGTLKFSNAGAEFGWFGGAGSTPDVFDMLFVTTGGALFPTYYQNQIGVILTAGATPFTGSFASSFANDGISGFADVVPEPGSIALAIAGVGLLSVGPLRRRLRRNIAARG